MLKKEPTTHLRLMPRNKLHLELNNKLSKIMEMLISLAQSTFTIDLFILPTELELLKMVSSFRTQIGNQKSQSINFRHFNKSRKAQVFLGNNQLKNHGLTKPEPNLMLSADAGSTLMVLKELKVIQSLLIGTNSMLWLCQKITTVLNLCRSATQ